MKISSITPIVDSAIKTDKNEKREDLSNVKNLYTQKLTKEEASALKEQIAQNSNAIMFNSANLQSSILSSDDKFTKDYQDFQNFLKDIGYDGKPIAELSQEEAAVLVSEDGFFGIDKTSQRIADFVLNGAGGDEDLLRAGREGVLQGFKEAEQIWGGKLPDISQKTMAKTIEIIDLAMNQLGFSIINREV